MSNRNPRTKALRGVLAAVAVAAAGFAAPAAATAHTTSHSVPLTELNGSGVQGHVNVLQKDGEIRVNVDLEGLEADKLHLQHIHGFIGGQESTCPGSGRDSDGDGLVSFAEGLPDYGPPVIVLGADVTPSDELSYSRTFTVLMDGQSPVTTLGALDQYTVVVHGMTVGDAYVPSLPVACANLSVSGSSD